MVRVRVWNDRRVWNRDQQSKYSPSCPAITPATYNTTEPNKDESQAELVSMEFIKHMTRAQRTVYVKKRHSLNIFILLQLFFTLLLSGVHWQIFDMVISSSVD